MQAGGGPGLGTIIHHHEAHRISRPNKDSLLTITWHPCFKIFAMCNVLGPDFFHYPLSLMGPVPFSDIP